MAKVEPLVPRFKLWLALFAIMTCPGQQSPRIVSLIYPSQSHNLHTLLPKLAHQPRILAVPTASGHIMNNPGHK